MKTPLQVGDRVAFYEGAVRFIGVISVIYQNENIRIEGNVTQFLVHKNQCRRLVKKKRRHVWIRTDKRFNNGLDLSCVTTDEESPPYPWEWKRFEEVK